MIDLCRLIVCLSLVAGSAAPVFAQSAVILVRHAERADQAPGAAAMMAADPELSDAGRARAESLARMLRDAGITAVFTTQFKRTRQTAEPLAKALGVTVQTVDARDVDTLVAKIKSSTGTVLVVGHSNSVPDTMKGLGVEADVTIAEAEYDNLFVVTRGTGPASMVRLRYR